MLVAGTLRAPFAFLGAVSLETSTKLVNPDHINYFGLYRVGVGVGLKAWKDW